MRIENPQDRRRGGGRTGRGAVLNAVTLLNAASFLCLLLYACRAAEIAIAGMPFSMQVAVILLAGYTLPGACMAAAIIFEAL